MLHMYCRGADVREQTRGRGRRRRRRREWLPQWDGEYERILVLHCT